MTAIPQSLTSDGLANLDAVLRGFVEDGSEPGIVSLISRNGEEHVTVVGRTGFGTGAPMTRDTLFRISSMTKPITATATLMLIDDDVLTLDGPIDDVIPELANRQVLRAPAGPLDNTVPASRPIMVDDLLTFRFGLGGIFDDSPIARALNESGVGLGPPNPASHLPAVEWLERLGALPLAYQPGQTWLYHTSAEILGILVARASGLSLDTFLQQRVFAPLGMVDTGFRVSAEHLGRLTDSYMDGPVEGQPVVWDSVNASAWAAPPVFPGGADGLVSTLDDYHRFTSMMMDGGRHDGQQLISPASHARMTTNHLTPEQIASAAAFLNGKGWGYGQEVAVPGNDHPGRYGWAGGMGTMWMNDPGGDLTMILMTPLALYGKTGPNLLEAWETAVYAALA